MTHRGLSHSIIRTVGGLVLAAAFVAATPVPAGAHAKVTSTFPAPGATITHSPGRIVLQFDQPVTVEPGGFAVTAADGTRVDKGDAVAQGPVVYTSVQDPIRAGSYAVAWKVRSEDGHAIADRFDFTVEAPAGAPGNQPLPATPTLVINPPPAQTSPDDGSAPLVPALVAGLVAAGLVVAVMLIRRNRSATPASGVST